MLFKRRKLVLLLVFVIVIGSVTAIIFTPSSIRSQSTNQGDWVSLLERIRIWDSIAGPGNYKISANELEAIFEKDHAKWTILGANAPVKELYKVPSKWPVKGDGLDVMVIPEPITDYKILPFTEPIENAVKTDKVVITAARNSYEPASFVIRAGDSDLTDITLEITNLWSKTGNSGTEGVRNVFSRANIDIRTVKCWFQAGIKHNDVKNKNLRPELLLHDDDLVRVDYNHQVNLIRNIEKVQDADNLKPFIIPKQQNKQIWLTVHVSDKTTPAKYYGDIKIFAGNKQLKTLSLQLEVLPIILPEPMCDYALFYLGYLSDKRNPLSSDFKTEHQMIYELQDMQEHGLTNATLYHRLTKSKKVQDINNSWKKLQRTLEIRQKVGWEKKPLLYLDWEPAFGEDLAMYRKKVDHIIEIAKAFPISEIYISGIDEAKGEKLLAERPNFETVHQAGAKNFAACTSEFFIHVPDLLDLPILHGKTDRSFIPEYKKLGKPIWVYSNIGAKIEEPETYRSTYGLGLLKDGFTGTCIFAYQAFYWNDFSHPQYRAHTLAYPTVTKPIPTLQWEGLRAGINDIRYITLLRKKGIFTDKWFTEKCISSATECRKHAMALILK